MRDNATEPAARAANTVALRRIDDHGSCLADLVIQLTTTSADTVGMAIAALMSGFNCAAAINGIRKSPILKTSDVQLSGDVIPVNTERMDTIATSALRTRRVTSSLVCITARATRRSVQTLQHATITT